MSIQKLIARPIFDSRGNLTKEVDSHTHKGLFSRAGIPRAASIGLFETLKLRDNNKNEFIGKGINQAVRNINEVIALILLEKNFNVTQQKQIDEFLLELNGTKNK